MKKAAIVGRRSWLAAPLARSLQEIGIEPTFIEKNIAPRTDLSMFQTVYLIAGRARPTIQERMEELHLVSEMMDTKRPPETLVYVSSLAVEREPTPYSQTKLACEKLVLAKKFGRVVRPPVIYGPTQDVNSDMLIPSIARAHIKRSPLILKQPLKPFYLMSADDVCQGMRMLGTGQIYTGFQTRILNLRSNPVTPMEVINMASPGLAFQVVEGWSGSSEIVRSWAYERETHDFTWNVNYRDIRETIEQHVKTLYMADVL